MISNEIKLHEFDSLYELKELEKVQFAEIRIEVLKRLNSIKVNIYEVGKYLSKAKSMLDHGKFQQWIKEAFDWQLPYSTAWNYIHIYETFLCNNEVILLFPVTFLMMMTRKSFPDTVRDLITNNPDAFKDEGRKIVEIAYENLKNNKISLRKFEKIVKDCIARENAKAMLKYSVQEFPPIYLSYYFKKIQSAMA
jgi:hypothetical protein